MGHDLPAVGGHFRDAVIFERLLVRRFTVGSVADREVGSATLLSFKPIQSPPDLDFAQDSLNGVCVTFAPLEK